MLTDDSDRPHVKKVLNSKGKSGFFIDKIDGIRALVTYVSSDSLDWKYIRITPIDKVLSKLRLVQLTTIIICFSIILMGLFAAYISSKRMYKPIESIIEKLDNLAIEKRKNSFQLKQELIKSVLLGSNSDSPKIVKNLIENYEVQFSYQNNLSILLLKIDNFASFCNMYNYDDRKLMKFGIMNIASELCGEYYKNEAIDMSEDHVVLVYNTPSDTDEHHKTINSIILKIQDNVQKHLEISLTACASYKGSCVFKELAKIYNELLETSHYKLFSGHKSILFVENIKFHGVTQHIYPLQKEKALIDVMLLGKLDKAKEFYLSIMENITSYTFSAFNSALLRLIFSINSAVETIEKNSDFPFQYNFNQFIADLNKLETLDEVNMKFFNVFEQISEQIELRKSSRHNVMIDKAIEIIHSEIKDYNLSLDMLAEKFCISSAHLGRLFKKQVGKSVADYINEVRLENAKYLLESTNMPINEIVQHTGFSSSNYFYIYFKKTHGVTPSEYRQKLNSP